jgi:hypothetical protein
MATGAGYPNPCSAQSGFHGYMFTVTCSYVCSLPGKEPFLILFQPLDPSLPMWMYLG